MYKAEAKITRPRKI